MDVEHGTQAVTRVRVEVAPIPLLGALVKVVVLRDQLLELGLSIEDLLRWELVLDHGHTRLLKVPQKRGLVRLQEKQAASLALRATRRSANTMNAVARIIRGIELDDPVNRGNLTYS